ncbi:MAG: ATP-binding protein [Methylotenera sp.]|nr:ATP-binding protein [Methylotenera sp.]
MNSLRLRLILLLSIGLGIAWLVAAWFTHMESRHEIDELFDAQLAQSAQVLLGTTRHELHERVEHGEDEVTIIHEYEQKLAFQIWDEATLLLRSTAAPHAALGGKKEGYGESTINGEAWRVLTKWDPRHEFMIQVAEPLAGRERLARHITLKMLLPTLIALPVLALLIWFGVAAGLRPLQQLKQEVKQRTANRLDPLAMVGVPEEVAPLAQALNELFARLQQAFEGERRFTADAAHELRTPLAALKIQAQVALRSTDKAEQNLALENVLHGVDRATRLVEQLLALARVDPETAAINYRQVDLHGLAATVMADLEPLAHAKQIEMTLEEDAACYVPGDNAQLGLLLRNLLDNAIRYTPAGGQVLVSARDANGIVLTVQDTGPGIPQAEREQVLQRFYRIAGSGEDGSGLGLSIVRRIAELHGARLELNGNDNDTGAGLRVSVLWPARQS